MLNRLTVSVLLKVVLLATSLWVVAGISLNAWDSWEQLQTANRISMVADISADLFKAMNNIRGDRMSSTRVLNSDKPMSSDLEKYLRGLRDAEMSAMARSLATLPAVEFREAQPLMAEFDRLFKLAEQTEFWEDLAKPLASRRPADAAAAAADDVNLASQTLETQSQQLGSQVTQFLGKIRAA